MPSIAEPAPYPGQVAPHPKEKREAAYALFAAGKPQTDIAFEMQLPSATIRAWSKRDNWEQRLAVEKAAPLDAETSARVAKALVKTTSGAMVRADSMDLSEKQAEYERIMGNKAVELAQHIAEMPPDQVLSSADRIKKTTDWTREALKLTKEKANSVIAITLLSTPTEKPIALDI